MKRVGFLFVFVLIFVFYLYFPLPRPQAQEFNFAKAYQDYLYTQTIYDQAYSNYDQAKNNYLKNPTLTLKEEARKKTYAMLTARDELFRVYLLALRMKLIESKAVIDSKLDEETAWYSIHKNVYKADDTLENLFNKSGEAESRFKSHTLPISYQSLFDISYAEVGNIRNAQENVYKSLVNSINLGVADGVLKLDPFNRWFIDIEGVLKEFDAITLKAKTRMSKMYESSALEPKNAFTGAIAELGLTTTKLTKLNSFLTELLNSINAQLTKS